MLKKLLLFLTLTNQLIGSCGKGCLKCSLADACQVCDLLSFYILKDKTCEQAETAKTDFCEAIDFAGQCLFCKPSYYLSGTTDKCIAVETAKLVDNCENYDSAQTCLTCKEKFRLEAGACVAITTNLANCLRQDSETTCLACVGGYQLSSTRETCTLLPTISNCLYVSKYKCQQCSSGFIFNPNLYATNLLRIDTEVNKRVVLEYLLDKADAQSDYHGKQVCQQVTVTNCLVNVDFKTCKTCMTGYFLTDDNKCQAFPIDRILNCRKYSANTVCIECEQGYLLTNPTICSKITQEQAKLNCTLHDPTTPNVLCINCKEGFVLANNSCTQRINLVANCAKQGKNKDNHCEECSSGFVLNHISTICGPKVPDCITYTNVTENASQCEICKIGYYLNENANPPTCLTGNKDFCSVYLVNQNLCAECAPGYFLNDSNLCIQHIHIPNCQDYSKTNRDQCHTCIEDYYPFTVEQVCVVKDVIFFCDGYTIDNENGTSTCNSCIEGKKLVVNPTSQCVDITIDHCLVVDGTEKCTKCKAGYGLNLQDPLHSCEMDPVFITQNCLTLHANQSQNFQSTTCLVCADNAFVEEVANYQMCIEDDKWIKLPGATNNSKVSNCVMYDETYMCTKCTNGYFLTPTNTCVNSCNGVIYPKKLAKYVYCDATDGNKKVVVEIGNTTSLLECQTELRLMDFTATTLQVFDSQTYSIEQTAPFNLELSDCPAFESGVTEVNGVAQTTTTLNKFQYVYEDANNANALTALRCKWGKTGSGDKLGDCSASITDCDASVKYEIEYTSNTYYLSLVACHKCNDNKTPVVFFTGVSNESNQDFEGYAEYTFENEQWTVGQNDTAANHHFCVDFALSAAQLKTALAVNTSQTIETVTNCGHYAMLGGFGFGAAFSNADAATATATNSTNQLFCIYCQVGFKPTYENRKVTDCTAILNCDTVNSTLINGCNVCSANYYHPYDSQNNVIQVQDDCIAVDANTTTIPNCKAIDSTDKNCAVCNVGYFKNLDHVCVKRTYPNCEDGYWGDSADDYPPVAYGANTGVLAQGCNKCKSGFFSIKVHPDNELTEFVCWVDDFNVSTKGTFVQTIQGTPVDSSYIDNCKNYQVNALPICEVCNDGFMLSQNGNSSKCYPVAENPNCLLLGTNQTNAGCVQCDVGFGRIPGLNSISVCSKVTIANCKTYNQTNQQPTVQCVECDDGFSLKNNICTAGLIVECKVYDNEIYLCNECNAGFILIDSSKVTSYQFPNNTNDSFPRSYCIANDDYLNCKLATLDGNNKLICTTCKEPSYLKKSLIAPDNNVSNDRNSLCLSYHPITNCVEYFAGTTLTLSNFSCTKCENQTHYRSDKGYSCTARTINEPTAKDFQISADLIETCIDNYFVKIGSQNCLPYPDGIIGCVNYENKNTCLKCNDSRFLETNLCKLVTEKVTNCWEYSADLVCSACKTNFYLNKLDTANAKGHTHECVSSLSNCLTQTSSTLCSKCQPGFNLNIEKTSCLISTKLNCALFESDADSCKICNKDYYKAADGNCTSVPTDKKIVECLQQATETTCALCSVGFALATDAKTCPVSALDANCSIQTQPDGGNCSVCEGGYLFDEEGVCKVSEGDLSAGNGCYTSVPLSEDCFICKPTHYMKIDQTCEVILLPTTAEPEGLGIARLIYVILLMLF